VGPCVPRHETQTQPLKNVLGGAQASVDRIRQELSALAG
jgi:hypothetical protein